MITRWRFWSSERRCSACSAAVMASCSWTQCKSYCCLHICVWVSTQTWDGTLLYFIRKSQNNRSKLTGRQMCENNSRNIHIIEAPAVSHGHHGTCCCSATFNTFCKSCWTKRAVATEIVWNRTEDWKCGDGKVAGLFIRQHFEGEFSARCLLTGEWLHGALMVTGTNGTENKMQEIKKNVSSSLVWRLSALHPDRGPPQDRLRSTALYKKGMKMRTTDTGCSWGFYPTELWMKGPTVPGPFYSYTLTARRDLWQLKHFESRISKITNGCCLTT